MPGVGKKRTGVCSSLKLFGAKSIRFVGMFLASLGLKRRYWQFFFLSPDSDSYRGSDFQ